MTISPDRDAETSVVHVAGALRAPTGGRLVRQVRSLLNRGERRIVLSLARLTNLDAEGIAELVRAYDATAATGGVLRIADVPERIRELLRRVGLLDLLEADSTRADEDETGWGRAGTAQS
jgi:anti-anti-sigma factor